MAAAPSVEKPASPDPEDIPRGESAAGVLFQKMRSKSSPLRSESQKRVGQDRFFRWILFAAVMLLMIGEVVVLVVLMFMQGRDDNGFHLDAYVLASFEVGVLLQTFFLARIITHALFPKLDP